MEFMYYGNSLKSGIYKITNKVNNKIYIGSAKEFKRRWNGHKNSLLRGTHQNKHLQAAFNLDGTDNFIFEVIEVVIGDKLVRTQKEKELLDQYLDKWDECYNFQKNPIANERPFFSKTPEETKRKMSEARIKFINSSGWKKCRTDMIKKLTGRKDYRKGRTFEEIYGVEKTKKIKKRMSNATTGKNNPMFNKQHSIKTVEKIKQSKLNLSPDVGQKISLSNKGRTAPNKGKNFEDLYDKDTIKKIKDAISKASKNRITSDGTRKKMSESRRGKSWGKHKSKTKKLFSKQRKNISFEKRYGIEKSKLIREKISRSSKDKNAKTYILTNNPLVFTEGPEIIYSITNLSKFCKDHNLCSSHLRKVINEKLKCHKGWHLKY